MPLTLHHKPPIAQSLPWTEPLAMAAGLQEKNWVLLYSGSQAGYSGRYSYLAWHLAERLEGRDFSPLEQALRNNGDRFNPAWFGYLGYGMKDCLETLTHEQPSWLPLPPLCMMRFHAICRFDHDEKTLTLWSSRDDIRLPKAMPMPAVDIAIKTIRSPMSQDAYLEKAAHIIDRIHAGDLYQANLTRKFIGEFAHAPDAFGLFVRLCQASPAPYSVFMQLGDTALLSSSPERFLTIDAKGHVTARPIKGTAARQLETGKDEAARQQLANSAKDRAENLMIVDLMRNDLSRACTPGSIQVERLHEVTTHATIHHMSSTVTGRRRPDCSTLDVVKSCFPPGSMTGAPKIKAMNLCAELEQYARGVYSGAIGWFGGDGSCDLSVVIRTLIVQDNRFEFQVGGGIVADSTPENELAETLAKARGILLALGISEDRLKGL